MFGQSIYPSLPFQITLKTSSLRKMIVSNVATVILLVTLILKLWTRLRENSQSGHQYLLFDLEMHSY